MSQRTQTPLDEEGIRLILEYAASVLHLETLLLIWESSARPWSTKELASRIYVDKDHAQSIVRDLERKGLLVPAGQDHYAIAADRASRDIAGKIAVLYRNNIFRVANLLHARPAASRHQPGWTLRPESEEP